MEKETIIEIIDLVETALKKIHIKMPTLMSHDIHNVDILSSETHVTNITPDVSASSVSIKSNIFNNSSVLSHSTSSVNSMSADNIALKIKSKKIVRTDDECVIYE
jgi:hypothetical protein